jgi:hypothetical protein
MWRGGCIIRSVFLSKIKAAFDASPSLPSLLLDPFFLAKMGGAQGGWRRVVQAGVGAAVPLPAMSAALAFYVGEGGEGERGRGREEGGSEERGERREGGRGREKRGRRGERKAR